MKRHLNTLFVTTQGAYLSKEGEAVVVSVEREQRLRVPIHTLGGIVCFGRVSASPMLFGLCGTNGVALSFLTENGRFVAAVQGFTPGNVLLRRTQYRWADDEARCLTIARTMVAAKLANSRTVLLRALRDNADHPQRQDVTDAIAYLARCAGQARSCSTLDVLRGIEGDGAVAYYGVFNELIVMQRDGFVFDGRNRRPPRDRVNALLSFLYAMLAHDARAACEASGLDAAVGFLHRDRPGRPGLALDLMEEFRAFIADRLVLSLINRQQVRPEGFRIDEGGAVLMDDATRKTVLTAYQERKQDTITHPFLGEETTVGLLVHLQARLLARFLRGDVDAYPAFIWR
ncbi:MAG: type I-C CRISPR-associated endonuclease Cas1c [Gemmatimonadales bacterium]